MHGRSRWDGSITFAVTEKQLFSAMPPLSSWGIFLHCQYALIQLPDCKWRIDGMTFIEDDIIQSANSSTSTPGRSNPRLPPTGISLLKIKISWNKNKTYLGYVGEGISLLILIMERIIQKPTSVFLTTIERSSKL